LVVPLSGNTPACRIFHFLPIPICEGIEGARCKWQASASFQFEELVSSDLIGVLFYAFTPFLFVFCLCCLYLAFEKMKENEMNCDDPDGQFNLLIIDPMVRHLSLVPRRTRLPGIYFPRRNEKTIAEDFTKTMGLRDNK
jgi:hypothetical protein